MDNFTGTSKIILLLIGDLIVYLFSLVLTLTIRYGVLPDKNILYTHLSSFLILFALFILVNFIVGLYEKQVGLIKVSVIGKLIQTQAIGIALGAVFFYFAPVSISPKANLFIYFIISSMLIFLWRNIMYPVLNITKRQNAILVGNGEDAQDLFKEINSSARYNISFKDFIVPNTDSQETISKIKDGLNRNSANIIVADFRHSVIDGSMSEFYSLIFSGVTIIDAAKLYESIFDRIPLTMVGERWLVESTGTSLGSRNIYDAVKRGMDVVLSFVIGIVSLIFYPFIFIAIKLEDRGSIFIQQNRIGKNGKLVSILKFRSMSGNDGGKYQNGSSGLKITKVGKFIRMTRIDELPQLWNVFCGDLSLIGPRPELPALVDTYNKEINFYNARHLVKPGLSGWAQIYHQAHPHHEVATEDTKDKLSYDLFYIKNRSLALDIKIALRTIQTILNVVGR